MVLSLLVGIEMLEFTELSKPATVTDILIIRMKRIIQGIQLEQGQIDTETKEKIETTAIETAVIFYIQRGYDVQSRESENVGYDLLASKEREILHVEVKGTSVEIPSNVNAMLTPNEYTVSKKSKRKYRICIVINALKNPEIFEFISDNQRQSWFSEQSLSCLKIKEYIAANLSIINC